MPEFDGTIRRRREETCIITVQARHAAAAEQTVQTLLDAVGGDCAAFVRTHTLDGETVDEDVEIEDVQEASPRTDARSGTRRQEDTMPLMSYAEQRAFFERRDNDQAVLDELRDLIDQAETMDHATLLWRLRTVYRC